MTIPILDANTAASYQTYAAAIQGVLTLVALGVAIWVPWWQYRKNARIDQRRRDDELAGLRLALHTEVGIVAAQCLMELYTWTKAAKNKTVKNPRTASFPNLIVYTANADRVGLLTRNEIVHLISFSGILSDIANVVADMYGREQTADDEETVRILLSNACGNAGRLLSSIPGIEGAVQDGSFIAKLFEAFESIGSHTQCGETRIRHAARGPNLTRRFLRFDTTVSPGRGLAS